MKKKSSLGLIISATLVMVVILLGLTTVCESGRHLTSGRRHSGFLKHYLAARMLSAQNTKKVPASPEEIDKELAHLEGEKISSYSSESLAIKFMDDYNSLLRMLNERAALLEYQFETNITDENEKEMNDFAPVSNRFQLVAKDRAYKFLQNSEFWDTELKRMLFLAAQGIVYKNVADVKKLANLMSDLESIYATAKVCRPASSRRRRRRDSDSSSGDESSAESSDESNKESSSSESGASSGAKHVDHAECLSLEPGLTQIMANSRDYAELVWAWSGWHNESGRPMRSIYTQTVEMQNKAARENNYENLSDYWIDDFEDDEFERKAAELFARIRPLYRQIHAYVRGKLEAVYGEHYPDSHDPQLIPAHLLGNMWGQTWENILGLVKPYPNAAAANVTRILLDNGYTPIKMFKEAENFFASIGLPKMTPQFWANSMIEKPQGREVVCHASALDLFNGEDFRIKMCTVVTGDNFNTIHHEMGHIEYYMAYKDQPTIFKTGANSAFHEAIGDTIALSVQTDKHLKAIHMIDDDSLTNEQTINFLMEMALQKVVFLPFAYLMDNWRWRVFRGEIDETNYNQKWWEMRKEYQGLEPPIERSEQDFDPGAKYHIAAYVPYARYYISFFLQFQFYKSLCGYAGHTGPLHTCDFYKSIEAGSHLEDMLKLGASKHWSYALEQLTGQSDVSADAILEYFKPLQDWLNQQEQQQSDSKFGM